MTREAGPTIAPPAQDALKTSREMLDRRPFLGRSDIPICTAPMNTL